MHISRVSGLCMFGMWFSRNQFLSAPRGTRGSATAAATTSWASRLTFDSASERAAYIQTRLPKWRSLVLEQSCPRRTPIRQQRTSTLLVFSIIWGKKKRWQLSGRRVVERRRRDRMKSSLKGGGKLHSSRGEKGKYPNTEGKPCGRGLR